MAPAWVKRLRDAVTPSPPASTAPPGPDPEHGEKMAAATRQRDDASTQLDSVRRLGKPLADTARRLGAAHDRNHFSELIEDMIQRGYDRPRGGNR